MPTSFWQFLDDRVKGREQGTPWFVNDKLKAYKFLEDIGVPTPKVIATFPLDELEERLSQAQSKIVLKPSNLHSANGVLPLIKTGADSWFDLLRSRAISNDAIIREQTFAFNNCKYKSTYALLFEELLTESGTNRISPDYKIYSFRGGATPLILRIDRNGANPYFTIYDGDLNILAPERIMAPTWTQDTLIYATAPCPPQIRSLFPLCDQITERLNTPFCSIDCYIVNGRGYVGEITPAPGAPYYKKYIHFSEEFDHHLGSFLPDSPR